MSLHPDVLAYNQKQLPSSERQIKRWSPSSYQRSYSSLVVPSAFSTKVRLGM